MDVTEIPCIMVLLAIFSWRRRFKKDRTEARNDRKLASEPQNSLGKTLRSTEARNEKMPSLDV